MPKTERQKKANRWSGRGILNSKQVIGFLGNFLKVDVPDIYAIKKTAWLEHGCSEHDSMLKVLTFCFQLGFYSMVYDNVMKNQVKCII